MECNVRVCRTSILPVRKAKVSSPSDFAGLLLSIDIYNNNNYYYFYCYSAN